MGIISVNGNHLVPRYFVYPAKVYTMKDISTDTSRGVQALQQKALHIHN